MPCDWAYVQTLTIAMDNSILLGTEGAVITQNILRNLLKQPKATVVYDADAECLVIDSQVYLYADRVEVPEYRKAVYQPLLDALPRLRALKLQQDIFMELAPQTQEITWLPDGAIALRL